MSGSNLPPADELASVRAQLDRLKTREAELRTLLLSDPSTRTGNRYVAEIKTVDQKTPDWQALRRMYPDIVAEHTYPRKVTRIELFEITEDGEIVRQSRKTKDN